MPVPDEPRPLDTNCYCSYAGASPCLPYWCHDAEDSCRNTRPVFCYTRADLTYSPGLTRILGLNYPNILFGSKKNAGMCAWGSFIIWLRLRAAGHRGFRDDTIP